MTELDPRLNAFRPDLADVRLRGRIEAGRFAEGRAMQVVAPSASIRKFPRFDSPQVTEALHGETLRVFDRSEGWAWVQLDADSYAGYVSADALSENIAVPTHRVAVPATFVYPEPNLKSQPATLLTLNARVRVSGGSDDKFAQLADGHFVFAAHLAPANSFDSSFVEVAGKFLHAPYYWGGKSIRGLDCSGLVQLSLEACGTASPRDSDMQEEALGSALMINDLAGLRRGDLVFWDGHVGILTDADTLLHANGHHTMVVAEPLERAVERIAKSYGAITSIKRF